MNASVASMIYKFNMGNIDILQSLGYQVDVACNFDPAINPISKEEIDDCRKQLKQKHCRILDISCPRSVTNIKDMRKTYLQLKKIADREKYDLVHTQSPIGGVLCRLAFREAREKYGTKVIYTAHGFHFYKGSPIQNWLFFYPVEKSCSKLNDVLITINHEDYDLAKKKFHTKYVEIIPGVGVDTKKFSTCTISKEEKRKELGIPEDAFVLLSVGELGVRKNQQVVIDALGEMKKKGALGNIYYIIAGKGDLFNSYQKSAENYGISDRVLLLGARDDVDELCVMADVFVHPSVREGLGIAPLEGMASGLPLISTYVNGIRDYTEDGVTGICISNPTDVKAMENAILKMHDNTDFRSKCAKINIRISEKYSINASMESMLRIYQNIDERVVNRYGKK